MSTWIKLFFEIELDDGWVVPENFQRVAQGGDRPYPHNIFQIDPRGPVFDLFFIEEGLNFQSGFPGDISEIFSDYSDWQEERKWWLLFSRSQFEEWKESTVLASDSVESKYALEFQSGNENISPEMLEKVGYKYDDLQYRGRTSTDAPLDWLYHERWKLATLGEDEIVDVTYKISIMDFLPIQYLDALQDIYDQYGNRNIRMIATLG